VTDRVVPAEQVRRTLFRPAHRVRLRRERRTVSVDSPTRPRSAFDSPFLECAAAQYYARHGYPNTAIEIVSLQKLAGPDPSHPAHQSIVRNRASNSGELAGMNSLYSIG